MLKSSLCKGTVSALAGVLPSSAQQRSHASLSRTCRSSGGQLHGPSGKSGLDWSGSSQSSLLVLDFKAHRQRRRAIIIRSVTCRAWSTGRAATASVGPLPGSIGMCLADPSTTVTAPARVSHLAGYRSGNNGHDALIIGTGFLLQLKSGRTSVPRLPYTSRDLKLAAICRPSRLGKERAHVVHETSGDSRR